jgi:hypothetical protein
MKYRDIIGFSSKKQKFVKKEEKKITPKPTVPPITKKLKEEFGQLNEWSEVDAGPKRWTGSGLTEHEQAQIDEGPAYEYSKQLSNVGKAYDAYWNAVKELGRAIEKKGQGKESKALYMQFRKKVSVFSQWFDVWLRKLM